MQSFLTLIAVILSVIALGTETASARVIEDATARPSRRSIRANVRETWVSDHSRYPSVIDTELSAAYTNAEFGVSIRYPGAWELIDSNEREQNLTLVMMVLAPHQPSDADVRENVNLVVETLPSKTLTLEEYTKLGLAQEQQFFESFTLTESRRVLAGRFSAQQVSFDAIIQAQSLRYRQVWFLRDGQAYVWTFADHPATFGKHVAVFERMMDSMRIE